MKEYTIKKGNHYSLHLPKLHSNIDTLRIRVNFDESCKYKFNNTDDLDINKLFGLSWGDHHKNSFRIGWNCNEDQTKIKLHLYWYNNTMRFDQPFCEVDFNKEKILYITINKYLGKIAVIDQEFNEKSIKFNFNRVPSWGYYLYPYFGGNNPAPHDIKVKLDITKL